MGGIGRTLIALAFTLSLMVSSAVAQDIGLPEVDWYIPEVTVSAKLNGPAIWKLRRGESEVWVIGVLSRMPYDMEWDATRLERALNGADLLITESRASVGLSTIVSGLRGMKMPQGQTLKAALTVDEYRDLELRAMQANLKMKDIERLKPFYAAMQVAEALYKQAGLTSREPYKTINRMAKTHKVKQLAVSKIAAKPFIDAMNTMDINISRACMRLGFENLDYALAHTPVAAKAWAAGDLKTIKANTRTLSRSDCNAAFKVLVPEVERNTVVTTQRIEVALSKPGKTVVVVSLNNWLAAGGVLSRLQDKGIDITTPRDG